MRLISPSFSDGGEIPRRHGHEEENTNPPLIVDEVPEEAVTLALVVDDPDAEEPAGKVWDHWVVWNIDVDASTQSFPDDWNPHEDGAETGLNDYGQRGYGGPNPPDREHTYRFRAYALDAELDLPGDATKEALLDAMEGHVLAEARLEGTYEP
ncbi:hypothetical protein SAMN04488063_0520 [Halopelagius inordinatus]|uniref:Phospholipid-binding protein, PBP family n=1 Tax=Halopelagius inordinatus TaxID=553467 RepID=A0A1I2M0K6_9EURY|nr:YbhB/YbcL family Raf kinase inhibitor-like protein [Halopelagius inordinatus]SFF85055.1 hypothetical protein SAMN04488063_0520 [Halopelagius inordinatus]